MLMLNPFIMRKTRVAVSSERTRPTGVTILAILEIISGIIAIAGGALLTTFAGIMGLDILGAFGGVVGGIVIALGIASFVMAYGLMKGKSWAWTITLILTIISLLFDGLSFNVIGIIIDVIILYYLTRPHVKVYFGKANQPL